MKATSDLDRLELALIDLEYAAADFNNSDRLKELGIELRDLRAKLRNVLAASRVAQQGVVTVRAAWALAKRRSDSVSTLDRSLVPVLADAGVHGFY